MATLKSMLKRAVPHSVVEWAKARVWDRQLGDLYGAWQAQVKALGKKQYAGKSGTLLIIPSDMGNLVGALGDEAMLVSALQNAGKNGKLAKATVLVSSTRAAKAAEKLGMTPYTITPGGDWPAKIDEAFAKVKPGCLLALGADIMDGYYNPMEAARILVAMDIASKRGIAAGVLGFSFNEKPVKGLKPYFDGVDSKVVLNLRDPISLGRFKAFSKAKAVLVADSAFCLEAQKPTKALTDWIAKQRKAGRVVVGVNYHPMLFKPYTASTAAQLEKTVGAVLAGLAAKRKVSWLLIPHDNRALLGDQVTLEPLAARLKGNEYVHYCGLGHPAAALKGLAGELDGLISGRMHLAIAAFGKGVPVLPVVYQGKFQGLLDHFGLPHSLALRPADLLEKDKLAMAVKGFLDDMPKLRAKVKKALPKVLALSKDNFKVAK